MCPIRVNEVDPPKCSGLMIFISVIEDEEVRIKILKHLVIFGVVKH